MLVPSRVRALVACEPSVHTVTIDVISQTEMEEALIEKVREHRVLYDTCLSEYRDQYMRQAAWKQIGEELQITGKKSFL